MAWDRLGLRPTMTQETGVCLASESGLFSTFLIQSIENGAQIRVGYRDFQNLSILTIANVYVVVKVKGARTIG